MLKKYFSVLITAVGLALLNACAVAIPVHEAQAPEVLDAGGMRLAWMVENSPALVTERPNVTNDAGEKVTLSGGRFELGVGKNIQLGMEFAVGGGTEAAGAIKYQWTGDNYFKSKAGNFVNTTVGRVWGSSGAQLTIGLNGTIFHDVDLNGNGSDISHFVGYRYTDALGVYGGAKYLFGTMKAKYRTAANGPVVLEEGRSFVGYGGMAGVFLSPHSEHIGFDLVFEAELMSLPATFKDTRIWYTTYAMTLALPFNFF